MLPHIAGSLTEEVEKVNLKALGFTGALIPGIPGSIGPFSVFDLRATGSWTVVDFHNIDNLRSADQNVKAAQFSYKDARDTVVLAVGANYLLTVANESRVEAAQAELATAQALFQLASDQEAAGLAPNIDTLRARVQLQTQQSTLIQAQNALEKQRIALARVIGLPVTQKFRLVNRVPYHQLPETALENAYSLALQTRPDYQAALALVRAAQLSREASWKERLPSIDFSGEYGVLGNQPSKISPNWTAAASLNIPIFQGGRIRSDEQQAEALLKQRQAQAESLKAGIEQEIEDAILDLKAAAQVVEVARTGLDFAQQTVTQSQDRFSAGVTNNVEVIQAQQQLASANDQYITSLYAHNIAKVLLARAVGNAEQVVKQYLAEPGGPTPNVPPSVQPPSSTPQPTGAAQLRATPMQPGSAVRKIDFSAGMSAIHKLTPPPNASRDNSAPAIPQQ
jgi:outer membrane protein TolC